MSNNPEQSPSTPESSIETQKSTADQLENSSGLSPRDAEVQTERARIKALETSVSIEAGDKEKVKQDQPRRVSISKKQRNDSYKRTMKQVQSELPPVSRTFSKIIHNNIIEKVSDTIGATIARPDAMLSGAVVSFVLTLLTYITAKTIGYTLSGFETIVAFIIGWIIGVTYDYLRVLFTGKKF